MAAKVIHRDISGATLDGFWSTVYRNSTGTERNGKGTGPVSAGSNRTAKGMVPVWTVKNERLPSHSFTGPLPALYRSFTGPLPVLYRFIYTDPLLYRSIYKEPIPFYGTVPFPFLFDETARNRRNGTA